MLDDMNDVADVLFWGAEPCREAFRGVAGMWKHRTDLPDFVPLRASWDRA